MRVLKEKIEAEKGKDAFPVSGQKLIYAGKILSDDVPIKEYRIDEKNFVVVMVTKVWLTCFLLFLGQRGNRVSAISPCSGPCPGRSRPGRYFRIGVGSMRTVTTAMCKSQGVMSQVLTWLLSSPFGRSAWRVFPRGADLSNLHSYCCF